MSNLPTLRLRGPRRRGRVTAGVLALTGSSVAELRRALAIAAGLAERCLLVAVDGGLHTCRRMRRAPDLWVGDGDSAGRVPSGVESVVYPVDKDQSDLAGALDVLRARGVPRVTVAGLLGGRLDHEWANVLELARRAGDFDGLVAPAERGTVLVTGHGCRVETEPGRTFSLFAPTGTATVTLRGARWELRRRRLLPGSHGLSNETGRELRLTVHRGAAVLVLIPKTGRSRS